MGIHDGHRARMKERLLEHGLDNFEDHNVLELLLFYAMPRGDVNPLAHRLLERFGNLSAVFNAPVKELMDVDGVGENTATLIKLIPQISRRYMMSQSSVDNLLLTSQAAGDYVKSYFYGELEEVVYLLGLDAKNKVISCRLVGRGSVNSASVSIRRIVELALAMNASSAIVAHNHTSGIALPSKEDELATIKVRDALAAVDVTLLDHIIVADDDFVSMADNGFFSK